MAEYTLSLRTASDYRMIKKILKAFDGATITPVRHRKSNIERSLEDAKNGEVAGPFNSVDQLMSNLLR